MQKTIAYALFVVLYSLVTVVRPAGAAADDQKITDEQLAAKARRLQSLVETKMQQAHGMIPMFVRAGDYQLPTAEDYKGAYRHRHLRGKTEEELGMPPMHVWRAWENTAANTGYYLRVATYQYLTTRDPQALEICLRSFAALKYIYRLPIENGGERGMLCKPYGGKFSNQTSLDQVQCVIWGLAAYRPIAPPEDVADIDRMTKDFAEYLMKCEYTPGSGYFGNSAEDIRARDPKTFWNWNRAVSMLPLLNMSWQGTGDDKFVKEINRWYTACEDEKPLAWSTNKFSCGGFGDVPRNIYLASLLMDMSPLKYEYWRGEMKERFRRARTGILEDGTWPTRWTYSKKAGMKPVELPSVGGGYGRTGRSTLFAMSCVTAQRWFPQDDMIGDARRILEGVDEDTMRFIMPLDAQHPLPAEWKVESEMLDGDSLVGWLCAYWEGHYRGYW